MGRPIESIEGIERNPEEEAARLRTNQSDVIEEALAHGPWCRITGCECNRDHTPDAPPDAGEELQPARSITDVIVNEPTMPGDLPTRRGAGWVHIDKWRITHAVKAALVALNGTNLEVWPGSDYDTAEGAIEMLDGLLREAMGDAEAEAWYEYINTLEDGKGEERR